MATSNVSTICFTCKEETTTYPCPGCLKCFCAEDLMKHREQLKSEFHEIEHQRNQLVEILSDHKNNGRKHPLFNQIAEWERTSIEKIRQTAEEQRNLLQQSVYGHTQKIETQFSIVTEEMQKIAKRKDFNEKVLNKLRTQLEDLKQQLNQPNHIKIKHDSSSTFIQKLLITLTSTTDVQEFAPIGAYKELREIHSFLM